MQVNQEIHLSLLSSYSQRASIFCGSGVGQQNTQGNSSIHTGEQFKSHSTYVERKLEQEWCCINGLLELKTIVFASFRNLY